MYLNFKEILGDLIIAQRGNVDGQYSQVTRDSRKVIPGSVFIAVRGGTFDGHDFIDSALLSGAKTIVAERLPDGASGVEVKDSAMADALLQQAFYEYPDKKLSLFGITGTNGKTTSVFVLEHIFNNCGIPCGLFSTIEFHLGSKIYKSSSTTPDSASFYSNLAELNKNSMQAAAFELSSHALHQRRVHGISLRGAVLTNITRDHLDYHGNAENYFQAKKICFTKLLDPDCGVAVINVDDAGGERMARELAGFCRVITFGSTPTAEWMITDFKDNIDGMSFTLKNYCSQYQINSKLSGRHNAENLTGTILIALDYGIPMEKILSSVSEYIRIPGRLERYIDSDGICYYIDYAHTPDALEKVLSTLKKQTDGKLIAVFGAGGDRDCGKRSEMGRTASVYADEIIITSDNPRSENPLKIIEDIVSGLPSYARYCIEPERHLAIKKAVLSARKGDVVLISGKGHEDYQEINGVKYPFSDAVELGKLLEELK